MMGNGQARSIIRRGNHFIYLETCGWVLIDGPWFKQLEGHIDQRAIKIFSMKPSPIEMVEESEPYPDVTETREVTWERIRWHPGFGLPYRPTYDSIVIDRRGLLIGFRGVRMEERWLKYLGGRTKSGWRMPDGKLPAYLCQPEFEEDLGHNDYLIRQGY